MEQIIPKLSVENTDLRYEYLLNDILVGLELALKNKKIIANKEVFSKIKNLFYEAKKIPFPNWDRVIDLNNQLSVDNIGLDALEIIREMIY
ncbi:hypothetical protein [Polaribacter porphyrae]|uniref:Uncharacterized protein n=1 Tax=Polaribacter porphyrae TaxID=1137780 RepID=A0A2S7WPQ1_9FLAO|nr:hypothetical protein [Polaribacter porphyrae]PQJ79261.1 hypothetical protein BTO18_08785 [Polaribacter porphyrae]